MQFLAAVATIVGHIAAVLPEGFALPELPYLVALGVGLGLVAIALSQLRPAVTDATVVALAPWMALGGVAHALDQVTDTPELLEPLLGTPSIYATVAVLAGAVWTLAILATRNSERSPAIPLGVVGGLLVAAVFAAGIYDTVASSWVDPVPAAISLLGAAVVAAASWIALDRYYTESTRLASRTGQLVLFAHALDGVSTYVGYDMVGTGERSPLSARILEIGGALPTAEVVGAGWLFVAVKVAVACVVIVLFREWLAEEPGEARSVLAGVAAVGLGPASNNLTLFTLAAV